MLLRPPRPHSGVSPNLTGSPAAPSPGLGALEQTVVMGVMEQAAVQLCPPAWFTRWRRYS